MRSSRFGYGVASVRFICGTQSVHRELEERLSAYLGMEDTILYSSCFDANGGLFETLLDAEDAVISDALNHASIIDGIRLCKARRLRYANNDMNELEQALKDSQGARVRLIATDGVFSMDGSIAKLEGDLRSGGSLRRAGHGRRLARHRIHRRARPRLARTARRHGPGRHHDRHPRQGAGRRERRLRRRAQGNRRLAAPAIAAVSVFEQHRAAGRRGDTAGARSAGELAGTARPRACERTLLSRADAELWASICSRASTPSSRSCSARLRSRCGSPNACRPTASTWSRSPFRSCPMEKRGYARN